MKSIGLIAGFICLVVIIASGFAELPVTAETDPIRELLNLPAPPRPNPYARPLHELQRSAEFYNPMKPPPDNAPIEDLLDYWTQRNSLYNKLGYNISPSPEVARRLIEVVQKNPQMSIRLLNVMPAERDFIEIVKACYQSQCVDEDDPEKKAILKDWLFYNSDFFIKDLEKKANSVQTLGEYVSNQDELLALVRQDWNRAEPIVNRLYADRQQRVPQVLATWALYRHALETNSLADIERYRDELKAIVEDKTATAAMRDLALDALVKEKEWSGRDEWYLSLLSDETLQDLKVNGQSFTGLTTIIYYSDPERFVDKMIELVKSQNDTIKAAAYKNLDVRLRQLGNTEWSAGIRLKIVSAILPLWWKNISGQDYKPGLDPVLQQLQILEVPGSAAMLSEYLNRILIERRNNENNAKKTNSAVISNTRANTSANTVATNSNVNSVISTSNIGSDSSSRVVSSSSNTNTINTVLDVYFSSESNFSVINSIVTALSKQKDPIALQVLRRAHEQIEEPSLKTLILEAIVNSGGFTPAELADAIVKTLRLGIEGAEITQQSNLSTYNRFKLCVAKKIESYVSRGNLTEPESDFLPQSSQSLRSEFEQYKGVDNPTQENNPEEYEGGEDCWNLLNEKQNNAAIEDERKLVVISSIVPRLVPEREKITDELLKRMRYFKNSEPQLSEAIRFFLLRFDAEASVALNLEDVMSRNFDAQDVVEVLKARKTIHAKYSRELEKLKSLGGVYNAIALCLEENSTEIEKFLESADKRSKAMAFACARLIRLPINLSLAKRELENTDSLVSTAAEMYLIAEDSPEARRILWAGKSDQKRVLGSRIWFQGLASDRIPGNVLIELFDSVVPGIAYFLSEPSPEDRSQFIHNEQYLRDRLNSQEDILGAYGFKNYTILIYSDHYVFQEWTDQVRYLERKLSDDEFGALKSFLSMFPVDNLPAFFECKSNCKAVEFLMFGRSGGQRIFGLYGDKPSQFFDGLESIFRSFAETKGKLHYLPSEKIKGLEIVYSDTGYPAKTVLVLNGKLIAVLQDASLSRRFKSDLDAAMFDEMQNQAGDLSEITENDEIADSKPEPEITALQKKIEELRYKAEYGALGWHIIEGDGTKIPIGQPSDFTFIPQFGDENKASRWKLMSRGIEIAADRKGIYKIQSGRRTLVARGEFEPILISADARWAFAYNVGQSWQLVKIDLLTGKTTNFSETEEGYYYPSFVIPGTNLILIDPIEEYPIDDSGKLMFYSIDSGDRYRLYNPLNGKSVKIAGEVRPLVQQSFRPLQPTGQPNEFWAAIPRYGAGTLVGKYRSDRFLFTPLLKLPGLIFSSMDMWVAEDKIYFVYNGDILSVPISAQSK